jgi:hypothetical protein
MAVAPKTNKELSIKDVANITGISKQFSSIKDFLNVTKDIDVILNNLKEAIPLEKKRLDYYKTLQKYVKTQVKDSTKFLKTIDETIKKSEVLVEIDEKRTASQKLYNAAVNDGNKQLRKAIQNNSEIFKISHEMQLESNVTWKNYTKLYNEAYKAVRQMRNEVNQSVFNVKDLVATQNKLLGTGWKNIATQALTNVSSSVMLMQKALGSMDENLSNAFQMSFRQFGNQTDTFITNIGNRLNAFSDTFGVSIGMLQGAVVDMMASNSFINRSNMEAQTQANESLIKAAALSGAIGLTTTSFLTNLALVSQYGTMEEMSSIYQGGALLQGFDTSKFQENMNSGNYSDATSSLFSGIYSTLNSIDDHYLRAEYMSQIGSAFGLSQSDLLQIATNGGNLDAYDEDMQSKLVDVNTSMKDEISNLKVAIVDNVENWLQNSKLVQGIGSVMQELGLYGLNGLVAAINAQLAVIIGQNTSGKIGTFLKGGTGIGTSTGTSGSSVSAGGVALGIGGLAVAGLGNIAGSAIQQNTNLSTPAANILGSGLNIGSGIIGGAMTGAAVGGHVGLIAGGVIGAGVGIANSIVSANKRKNSIKELDDQERASRAAKAASSFQSSGDPVVDAINKQTESLIDVLNLNAEENRNIVASTDMYTKTTTINEI